MGFENVTEIEWAQLAAWIDSDGCIGIGKAKTRHQRRAPTYHPQINVWNTDQRVMEWLQRLFGGGVYSAGPRTPTHKPRRVWTCSTANHVALLKGALPYFLIKQDRALLVISYHEDMLWHGRARKKHGPSIAVPSDEVTRREVLHQQIRKLNQLGPSDESD